LKKITNERVSDEQMANVEKTFPINPPRNKEGFFFLWIMFFIYFFVLLEYYYRTIFSKYFPSDSAARTVPSVPSVGFFYFFIYLILC
jgi:asparagine synthase (glutamine-hydrolysing)